MKKTLAVLLFLLVPLSVQAQEVESITKEVKQIRDSTVIVKTHSGHGSGSVILHEGKTYVITAFHLVDDIIQIRSFHAHGKTYTVREVREVRVLSRKVHGLKRINKYSYSAKVVEINPLLDFAILELVGKTHFEVGVKFNFDHIPKIAENVIHSGAMKTTRYYNAVTTGKITQVAIKNTLDFGPRLLDMCDAIWYPGSSGGGVFNEKGEYIGMCVQWGLKSGLSLYSPARSLKDWCLKKSKFSFLFKGESKENPANPLEEFDWRDMLFPKRPPFCLRNFWR